MHIYYNVYLHTYNIKIYTMYRIEFFFININIYNLLLIKLVSLSNDLKLVRRHHEF